MVFDTVRKAMLCEREKAAYSANERIAYTEPICGNSQQGGTKLVNAEKLMPIVLMVALVLSLTACGSSGGNNATLTGKYSFVSMESKGETVDAEAVAELGMDASVIYLEFAGNKVTMRAFGETIDVMYKVDGKNIEINTDDGPLKGTLDGNMITIDFGEGEVLVVEKK